MKTDETTITVGVDVSKQRLDVFELGSGEAYSIPNSLDAIEQWLDRFQISIRVAIEPTNSYHEMMTQAVHARGHQVYLIGPHRLAHSRHWRSAGGLGVGAKPSRPQLHLAGWPRIKRRSVSSGSGSPIVMPTKSGCSGLIKKLNSAGTTALGTANTQVCDS